MKGGLREQVTMLQNLPRPSRRHMGDNHRVEMLAFQRAAAGELIRKDVSFPNFGLGWATNDLRMA
jgi:hypothetical protein